MNDIYYEVSIRLDLLDFSKLWKDFHRYSFALYNSTSVWLNDKVIPWDNRFLGNTAILLDGEYIAIWNVEDDLSLNKNLDMDILCANLVHEMFHAFQQEMGETRFPNDLKTLTYTDDIGNFILKLQENSILAEIFETIDLTYKKKLLSEFVFLRTERQKINRKSYRVRNPHRNRRGYG